MPLQDAARAACVSHTFLRSWRCYPKLTFTNETLGLKRRAGGKGDIARGFTSKVDHILKKHSGIGLKKLWLQIHDYCDVKCYLNSWLQIAISPGIEEVALLLPSYYNLQCSLLFNGRGNSIRDLYLTNCAFRPTVVFDCLRSLAKLHLYQVRITGDELGCLLSNSFLLEHLELRNCSELICLKIPFCLVQLSFLSVVACQMLQKIEIKAPNLSTFRFYNDPVQLSLGESSQMKDLNMKFSHKPNSVSYAITKLPYIVPHLETLAISSFCERVNTPMVANKFLHLKYLEIYLASGCEAFFPAYDYLSLVSFLDASPVLETFILSVHQDDMKHDSVFEYASHMRQMPEHKHGRLKNVQIIGFCSAKSMVELTCHILENATSLESLTVDTIYDEEDDDHIGRCSVRKTGKCSRITRHMIIEAHRALKAIKRYILGKVPATVKLNVREPCRWCHAIKL
uniref:At1g61320/AtMIF1 LRR domain-containing protein n=1 Tax=Arundo donax TaxID=35708 RepID=A0A0A9HGZ0_ARUDO